MAQAAGQRTSRADGKLDTAILADLPFFTGPNRTKKHKAAIHLAEGRLTQRQIAATLSMSRSTLNEWKDDPDFQAVQAVYEEEIRAESLQFAIADKTERLRGLDALNTTYWQIKQARAERHRAERQDTPEAAMRGVFGDVTPAEAETGMFVRQPKIAANGTIVVEWAFDKALDSAIKETYREAAAELGQRTEKHEIAQHTTTMVQIIGDDGEAA